MVEGWVGRAVQEAVGFGRDGESVGGLRRMGRDVEIFGRDGESVGGLRRMGRDVEILESPLPH